MTAKDTARRLVAAHGREGARTLVLARMQRHHALCQDAAGRDLTAFIHAAARFTLWGSVSLALLRASALAQEGM